MEDELTVGRIELQPINKMEVAAILENVGARWVEVIFDNGEGKISKRFRSDMLFYSDNNMLANCVIITLSKWVNNSMKP